MMNEEVRRAGGFLQKGRIILYPTDTIWGLGCDATDPDAVSQIYRIKQRSEQKYMLVLVDGISMLASLIGVIPESAGALIHTTHRPTTIIYPQVRNLAANLVAADGSVGIRVTRDPFCRQLIRYLGKPVVSTSANLSGREAPSSFGQIDPEILEKVDYIVNWRRKEMAESAPSTIVKLEADGTLTTLRP